MQGAEIVTNTPKSSLSLYLLVPFFHSLQVMRCISQLELAQLISTGVNPQVLLNTGGGAGKGGGANKRGGAGKQKELDVSTPRLTTQLSMNSVLGSGG